MLRINNQEYEVTNAFLTAWIETEQWNRQTKRYVYGEELLLNWSVEFNTAPSSLTSEEVALLRDVYGGNEVIPCPEIAILPIHAVFGQTRHPNWQELEGITINVQEEDLWAAHMGYDGDFFGGCVKNVARFGARDQDNSIHLRWDGVCTCFLMEDGRFPFTLEADLSFSGIGMRVRNFEDADKFFSAFYDPSQYWKEVPSGYTDWGRDFDKQRRHTADIWYRPLPKQGRI